MRVRNLFRVVSPCCYEHTRLRNSIPLILGIQLARLKLGNYNRRSRVNNILAIPNKFKGSTFNISISLLVACSLQPKHLSRGSNPCSLSSDSTMSSCREALIITNSNYKKTCSSPTYSAYSRERENPSCIFFFLQNGVF